MSLVPIVCLVGLLKPKTVKSDCNLNHDLVPLPSGF